MAISDCTAINNSLHFGGNGISWGPKPARTESSGAGFENVQLQASCRSL
uniref:Uncharacterized protein n=1 Tax=Anguilla anguilla TaxID=7936 RepID=A0A0E9PCX7_ANGAN